MATAPEALFKFPPNQPKLIVQRAFERARKAVNNVLNAVEKAILAAPLTWLSAVIISIILGHAVRSFVHAVRGLLFIAKKPIPYRGVNLPEDHMKDLSEVYDVLSDDSENLAVD